MMQFFIEVRLQVNNKTISNLALATVCCMLDCISHCSKLAGRKLCIFLCVFKEGHCLKCPINEPPLHNWKGGLLHNRESKAALNEGANSFINEIA